MVQRHTTNQLCLKGFERAVVHPKNRTMTSTQNFLPTVSLASFRIPLGMESWVGPGNEATVSISEAQSHSQALPTKKTLTLTLLSGESLRTRLHHIYVHTSEKNLFPLQ